VSLFIWGYTPKWMVQDDPTKEQPGPQWEFQGGSQIATLQAADLRARIHVFFRLINGRNGHGFARKNCRKNWDEMDLTLNTIKNPGVQIVGSPSRSLELVATLSGALCVESALFPPQGILLLHRGRGFESVQRCSKARVNSKEKVAWSERSVRTWLELFRV